MVVQSIDRAFSILEVLTRGPAGVSELAVATGLAKSTVSRLLGTLVVRGAVEQDAGDSRYRLGPLMARLAGAATPTGTLIGMARPHLADLTAELGEASGLSIADGYDVLYLDQVESPNPVQVRDWTGTHLPLHVVPSGIVMLAHWPADAVDRYVGRELAAFTMATVTDPRKLRSKLAAARAEGHAWGLEEFAEGINSVAAPVRDASGAVVAAAHAHGPAYRFPTRDSMDHIAARIVETAQRISGRLLQM